MGLILPAVTRTGAPDPVDVGVLAWTHDPVGSGTAQVLTTAGTMYGARVYLPKASTVTNITTYIQTAGATLTSAQCKGAVFDASGNLQGTLVDQATAWASTGFKTMALASTFLGPAGYYDVCLWFNGTTGPSLTRGSGIAAVQGGSTLQGLRFFSADTGRTTTAPSTLGTKTAVNFAWWLGLS
jgi:hypothetical protein